MSTTNASLINHTIGNYRVTSLLGEGGMGVVYLAQHPVFGRKVAIKLLHAVLARDQDIVARFFNEARAIHMVAHENIVEILDFGQTPDGQPYFIMEYLSGESLTEAIARGPMTPEQVEAIAVQMCRALGAAHAKGIVHRDLKPHNVQLVIKADGALQVKILDFGVAKILASPDGASSVKTRTGSLMGTPLYMSPEQCKGAGVLDHRTDIYSLGVILFEMIGPAAVQRRGRGRAVREAHAGGPAPVTDFAPHAPPHMAAAIMKSLAKDPAARFQTMEDYRKAIVGEVKVTAPPASPGGMRRLSNPAANTMAQTVSSRATTSTLSSASSEIEDELALKPKRTKLFAAVGGGAALLAVGYFAFFKEKAPPPAPPPVATTTTAVKPPPPQPPPAPVKKTVTIRFEADPPARTCSARRTTRTWASCRSRSSSRRTQRRPGPTGWRTCSGCRGTRSAR